MAEVLDRRHATFYIVVHAVRDLDNSTSQYWLCFCIVQCRVFRARPTPLPRPYSDNFTGQAPAPYFRVEFQSGQAVAHIFEVRGYAGQATDLRKTGCGTT